nr:uracil-DNA glycosylase, mitochondrial-like [Ipomoea batatas]
MGCTGNSNIVVAIAFQCQVRVQIIGSQDKEGVQFIWVSAFGFSASPIPHPKFVAVGTRRQPQLPNLLRRVRRMASGDAKAAKRLKRVSPSIVLIANNFSYTTSSSPTKGDADKNDVVLPTTTALTPDQKLRIEFNKFLAKRNANSSSIRRKMAPTKDGELKQTRECANRASTREKRMANYHEEDGAYKRVQLIVNKSNQIHIAKKQREFLNFHARAPYEVPKITLLNKIKPKQPKKPIKKIIKHAPLIE